MSEDVAVNRDTGPLSLWDLASPGGCGLCPDTDTEIEPPPWSKLWRRDAGAEKGSCSWFAGCVGGQGRQNLVVDQMWG